MNRISAAGPCVEAGGNGKAVLVVLAHREISDAVRTCRDVLGAGAVRVTRANGLERIDHAGGGCLRFTTLQQAHGIAFTPDTVYFDEVDDREALAKLARELRHRFPLADLVQA